MLSFFANRGPKNLPQVRPGGKNYETQLRALLGAGFKLDDPIWTALKGPTEKDDYWGRCLVVSPAGKSERAKEVIKRMNKSSDALEKVDSSLYRFTETEIGWRVESSTSLSSDSPTTLGTPSGSLTPGSITGSCVTKIWNLEAKLVLSQKELESLLPLLEAFVPLGTEGEKTVSLQADSHPAGDCWVGLIASYDSKRIPFIPISGDIGCGMALLPLVASDGCSGYRQVKDADETLKMRVCYRARKVLGRGKKAENGELEHSLISEALTFLGEELSDLVPWLDQFERVLKELDIPIKSTPSTLRSDCVASGSSVVPVKPGSGLLYSGLNESQSRTLKYILGFAMTLGSSGNHFLEMNSDPEGYVYLTIHSGSRGLGALLYQKIADIAYVIMGSSAVAVDWLADIYNRTFAVLNRFAILNRLCCGLAVLKDLSFVCDGRILREVLVQQNSHFSGIPSEEVANLLRGVTHNGIKCFVNTKVTEPEVRSQEPSENTKSSQAGSSERSEKRRQKIFVMSKGAISISAQAACGIVALRAGEGVYLMTFLDPSAEWVEHDLSKLDEVSEYEEIYDLSKTDILLMGHGAGRSGSATGTWKSSEYKQMVQYYEDKNIWGNLSPNVLGDNPEIAYKPVIQVMRHLPLDKSRSHALLRTLVNHKEGIDYRPQTKEKFAQFVAEGWCRFCPKTKIMCDLVLVTQELTKMKGKEWFEGILAEQEQIYQSLLD